MGRRDADGRVPRLLAQRTLAAAAPAVRPISKSKNSARVKWVDGLDGMDVQNGWTEASLASWAGANEQRVSISHLLCLVCRSLPPTKGQRPKVARRTLLPGPDVDVTGAVRGGEPVTKFVPV